MAEAARRVGRIQHALVLRELQRVGIEPPAVGADGADRRDLADVFAGKIAATFAVAGDAALFVERLSTRGERRIDRVKLAE